ncbi:metalloprotease PmbA [Salinisphaera sp. USBA-960]|nr:metalloprotease PmbA [Salifodinibacter halophilus]NNC26788.1 metalloprotease PmbA [Salifodinibacter halophilus]
MAETGDAVDVQARVAPQALREQVAALISDARRGGADAAEVGISAARSLSVSARAGQRESVESANARSAGVTVYRGQRSATATTSDLSADGLAETLTRALEMARFTEPDPDAGLADASLMASGWPELSLNHPWALDADEAERRALAVEAAAFERDARVFQVEAAQVGTESEMTVYANSHGFIAAQAATQHAISCSALARDDNGMQRDVAFSPARAADDLASDEAIGRRAVDRAVARLGARTPPTTTAPVLFEPRVAASLWQHLIGAISGGALYKDASFLKDRMGDVIAAPALTLTQSPHRPRGLASAGFDGDGVATAERKLVDNGVLTGYVLGSYSARRLGMTTTGNAGGVFNPAIAPGEHEFEALIARMGRGLVVTELMGQGVDLTTGDYSRGAAGFWVENGEIAYPVENVTIAGNLSQMFQQIDALGNDVDTSNVLRTPSVLIERMTIAGN